MIYEVKSPILGFEKIESMELKKIDEIFAKLTDSKNQNISFTLVNPFSLRDYDVEIPQNYQDLLQIDKDTEVEVYCTMILQNPILNSTINFLAPIIFNNDKKIMGQIVLDNTKYPNYSIAEQISNYLSKY